MARLSISQVPGSNPPQFIARNRDTEQSAPEAIIPSPYEWPVPNAGDEPLMVQLRWHLETFLSYPFEPHITRAAHIEAALKAWGTAAFAALFDNRATAHWLSDVAGTVHDILISSDDPVLLAWPWEALHDSTLGYFAHRARIQRRLNHDIPEPPALTGLPQDRIHILLITARPFEDDVEYRSISRPLVDLIRREKLPTSVQVLRPPTFDALQQHLAENPRRYHILHFDGHGGYGAQTPAPNPGHFHGSEGRLLFEKNDGSPDEITAARLATMLQGCTIPFVVLNACRSATLDAQAAEGRAFASVAGALVRAGFRSVLAMAYNLTVTGAQQFLPVFYQCLFQQGNMLEAARAGRLRMFDHATRSAWNPAATLPDWLLPVVYQQRDDFDLSFDKNAAPLPDTIALPDEATVADPLGFTGRDSALHLLERELRRPAAAILIHGLGGIGKTTLTRHFLQWLRDTGGLAHPPFWFSFDDIRSGSFVFNTLGHTLLGPQFDSDQAVQLAALITALKDSPFIIVWDNFESARGFQTEHVSGLLPIGDPERLRDLLAALHGGKTKILITSRSDEAWLSDTHCRRLPLFGLRDAELWNYAAGILDDLDLKVDRNDSELLALMRELGGHPVLLRAILPELKRHAAASLRKQWQTNLEKILKQIPDPAHARLLASLDLAGASFSKQEKPYLIPLGLHERFVDLNALHMMSERGVEEYQPDRMEQVATRLVRSGLLTGLGQNIFALHPLLTSYLRVQLLSTASPEQAEKWEAAFVEVMARLADALAPKELYEQRRMFSLHHANFHQALDLAEARDMPTAFAALTQFLAFYALNMRNWAEALVLFKRLMETKKRVGDLKGEATVYHQLGAIAFQQGNFTTAEHWQLQSLAISEKLGYEHLAASTYHQLGNIARTRRDFASAERWHLQALAISEIQGDEHLAAKSYHVLGTIALDLGELPKASAWYQKSLAISQRLMDETQMAMTYHQLGIIAFEHRDFATAERWYLQSLAISEKQDDEHGAASTYHQLGNLAIEHRDFAVAERWYLQSLAIQEKQGDEHDAAMTYLRLGILAYSRGHVTQAGAFFLKTVAIFARKNDDPCTNGALKNFIVLFRNASPSDREHLRALGREGLGNKLMQQIEQAAESEQT